MVTNALLDVLPASARHLPALADAREVAQLPGGLTNRNFKVTTSTGACVVRVSSPQSSLLSIDRDAEHLNCQAAHRAGIGPAVIDYLPGDGVLVIGWVTGRTCTDADLQDPVMLGRVAQACRRLHSGPRFVGEFDMFALQRKYLNTVTERGFRLPGRYLEFMPQVDRIWQALAVHPVAAVPCHNDLLAANLIDDEGVLWVIDYEYSGNNDPYFELGNIWSEANLAPDLLDELVTAYHGGRSPALIARARLQALMSKYGWMLWASIQDGISTLDFDFWSWGLEKYDRAVAEFDGPLFEQLLDAAAAPT